ncbi:MAG: hypothetical protein JST20_11685 [Bacteroidetes bacterium]|nr:hypothetical protein [Bacteroidota bacterium]
MIFTQNSRYFSSQFFLQLLFVFAGIINAPNISYSQQQSYKPFTKEQIHALVPSSSRFVSSLQGKWERSPDNGNSWDVVELPFSELEAKRVTYRRALRIEKDMLQKYSWQLYCTGVSDEVEVYINKQYVGRYFGGMTPFYIKLPDRMIAAGTNTLELVVSPMPPFTQRHIFSQKSYTGVIRELLLVGMPQIWVNDVRIKSTFSGSTCDLKTSLTLSSGAIEKIPLPSPDSGKTLSLKKFPVNIEATLHRMGKSETISQSEIRTIEIERDRTIPIDLGLRITSPELWSPSEPNLYEMTIKITKNSIILDEYVIPVGLHDIRITNDGEKYAVMLNGSPFTIKGVEYSETFGGVGQTVSNEQLEKDVLLLKTLGVNVVRLRFAPPHPFLAELCNKNGLLLLVDFPAYDIPASVAGSDEFLVRMNNIAERSISYFDRQPCLLGWGIGDGFPESSSEVKKYQENITSTIHQLSSKILYKTVRFGAKNIITDGIDLICFRADKSWQPGDDFRDEIERMRQLATQKAVMVCYGKLVQPNNLNGYADPLSVESQAQYIRDCYRTVQQTKAIGSIVWTFNDYSTTRQILSTNSSDQFVCTSGLMDEYRQPRLSYFMYKALLNDEKEPLLRAGNFKEDTPVIYIGVGLLFGILIFLLMSRFRRFREYIGRAIFRPYNFYSDIRDQRILSTFQTLALGVAIAGTGAIILSSVFYFYRASAGTEFLFMMLVPNIFRAVLDTALWNPAYSLLLFTLLILLKLLGIALIIRMAAFFVRSRIFYTDALTISIWSVLPLLILLPIAMGLFKILTITSSHWLLLSIMGIVIIWCTTRTLEATAVVFDLPKPRVYLFGIIIIIIILGSFLLFMNYRSGLFNYLQYYFAVMR